MMLFIARIHSYSNQSVEVEVALSLLQWVTLSKFLCLPQMALGSSGLKVFTYRGKNSLPQEPQ